MMSLPMGCGGILVLNALAMLVLGNRQRAKLVCNVLADVGILGIFASAFFTNSISKIDLLFPMALDSLSLTFATILILSHLFFTLYNPTFQHTSRRASFFTNLLVFFIFSVLASQQIKLFLLNAEGVILSIFFLLLCTQRKSIRLYNVWLYFIITQIAFFLILCAFNCYMAYSSDLSFDGFYTAIKGFPLGIQTTIFVLLFTGLAIMSGIFPFHVWVPSLFASVPTMVVGLMSSSLLSLGLYGMFRFLDPFLFIAHKSWGVYLIVLGTITLGSAIFSLSIQVNFRRYIAFSLIFNNAIVIITLGIVLLMASYHLSELLVLACGGAMFLSVTTSVMLPMQTLGSAFIKRISGSYNINQCGAIFTYSKTTGLLWLLAISNIVLLPPGIGFYALAIISMPIILLFSMPEISWVLLFMAVFITTILPLSTAIHTLVYQKAFGIGVLGNSRSNVLPGKLPTHSRYFRIGLISLMFIFIVSSFPFITHVCPAILADILHMPYHAVHDTCMPIIRKPMLYIYGIQIFLLLVIFAGVVRYLCLRRHAFNVRAVWNQGFPYITPKMYGTASAFTEQFNEMLTPKRNISVSPIPRDEEFPAPQTYRTKSDIAIHDWFFTRIPYAIKRAVVKMQFEHWKTYWVYLFYIFLLLIILIGIQIA